MAAATARRRGGETARWRDDTSATRSRLDRHARTRPRLRLRPPAKRRSLEVRPFGGSGASAQRVVVGGEEGTHDSESGRFGEGERASARDVDAAAVTTVVAARTSELEIAAGVASVTRDGNAVLGALVTASSGACTVTTLFTGAGTGMEGELESAVAAAAVSRALSSCAGSSQAPSSRSNGSNTCSGGVSCRRPTRSQARSLT